MEDGTPQRPKRPPPDVRFARGLLHSALTNQTRIAKFADGLLPDQAVYVRTLFQKMLIDLERGNYGGIFDQFLHLETIIEALKPHDDFSNEVDSLRMMANEFARALQAEGKPPQADGDEVV